MPLTRPNAPRITLGDRRPPAVRGFTTIGDAAQAVVVQIALKRCLAALKAAEPILTDIAPGPNGPRDPELTEAVALVKDAIFAAEAVA